MNIAIRQLPKSVQSLICASNQINCYKKAVQELVFNALDADATSIAVRIHIAESSIQVVDNGCGISQADFKYIGQNYMTSKLVDISTLRSAPNKYGFQGQSLANIAQISETLKVTSRSYKCDTTCIKIFENGKAKSIAKCSLRPSKGTTIEVKGFLYNLSIKKKSVDLINELQSIKTILEHISLVHSSISLSLRDDSKNDIVYKIHKNRDIYQTLYSLYEIEKANVQELQVEKNQYKVKAFVGNSDAEIKRQSIFLNGKFIADSSILYTKVNENFKKYLKRGNKKMKKDVYDDDDENHIFGNKIQFYFIFITCPYMDYELTNTVLEFKDWGQINTILAKVVKFYTGDTKLTEVPKKQITRFGDKKETESTKNKIEKIIYKILGNHCKNSEISHVQKGVKGKLIRRKAKINLSNVAEVKKYSTSQNISKQVIKKISSDKATSNEKNPIKNNADLKMQAKPRNNKNKKRHSGTVSLKTSIKRLNQAKRIKKLKVNSKQKTQNHLCKNNRKNVDEQTEKPNSKKISLNNKFAMETESVKKRCELLARKTEFIKNNRKNTEAFINENCQYTRSNFITSNKKIAIKTKDNEIVIHECIPLPPKFGKQVGNNDNNKQFKSNYDLLQTIINSQQKNNKHEQLIKYVEDCSVPDLAEPNFYVIPKDTETSKHSIRNRVPLVRELKNKALFHEETPSYNSRLYTGGREIEAEKEPVKKSYKHCMEVSRMDYHNNHFQTDTPDIDIRSSHRETDEIVLCTIRPYLMRASDNISPFEVATFQSHNYVEKDIQTKNIYRKPRNFITTQSRENFIDSKNNTYKTNNINLDVKLFQSNNHKRKINKSMKMFNMVNNTVKDIRESYTIEFTENNKHECIFNSSSRKDKEPSINQNNAASIEAITPSMSYLFNDSQHQYVPQKGTESWLITNYDREGDSNMDYEPLNNNTITITNSYKNNNLHLTCNDQEGKKDKTYTIDSTKKFGYQCSNLEKTEDQDNDTSETNFVFVSKSQQKVNERQITNPIELCETVLKDQEISTDGIREFDSSFHCIKDFCDNLNVNNNIGNDIRDLPNKLSGTINMDLHQSPKLIQKHDPILSAHHSQKKSGQTTINELEFNKQNENVAVVGKIANEQNETRAFIIRNRMFFVPKGMSPIFDESHTKHDGEYNPKEDYYDDKIYHEFVDKVEKNTEILKPRVQDSSDLNPKNNNKVNNKLNKDNASLKFDGLCIKNAKVLRQVDSKYIAAIMKSKCHETDAFEEFLVLFDQHAVHERIRLENNLADYLIGSQWKSVTIDEVSLKMSRDEILCLHNYRDKFTQLGLQWNILNYSHVSITAIPKAILGKNPRQVDKIMKAVKNLITEEMNIIQMQRGCVSQYPKSIMDLVFSEACRYSIKFGDHLSKSRCIKLIDGLSDCKTPFQCAHGRPSMAVIMNIERHQANYEINYKYLERFSKSSR